MPPGGDHDSGHESTSVHKPKMRGDLSTLSIQIWSIHVAEFSVRREDMYIPTHIYILKNGDSSAGRVLCMQLSHLKHVKLECRLLAPVCILQKRNCKLLA
jgi:hypothetical protein